MADKSVLERAPKMTVLQAALACVATNIGGGLLGLPYACYHLGLFLGVILIVFVGILSHLSSIMHMKVKDLTPRRYESVYEIAYLLVGRASIFVVTSIMMFGNFLACVMFYMVLGETLSTLFT